MGAGEGVSQPAWLGRLARHSAQARISDGAQTPVESRASTGRFRPVLERRFARPRVLARPLKWPIELDPACVARMPMPTRRCGGLHSRPSAQRQAECQRTGHAAGREELEQLPCVGMDPQITTNRAASSYRL